MKPRTLPTKGEFGHAVDQPLGLIRRRWPSVERASVLQQRDKDRNNAESCTDVGKWDNSTPLDPSKKQEQEPINAGPSQRPQSMKCCITNPVLPLS